MRLLESGEMPRYVCPSMKSTSRFLRHTPTQKFVLTFCRTGFLFLRRTESKFCRLCRIFALNIESSPRGSRLNKLSWHWFRLKALRCAQRTLHSYRKPFRKQRKSYPFRVMAERKSHTEPSSCCNNRSYNTQTPCSRVGKKPLLTHQGKFCSTLLFSLITLYWEKRKHSLQLISSLSPSSQGSKNKHGESYRGS